MPLSWNEIKQRAIAFSREWKEATSERAESQSFWNEFFEVFGKRRRQLAAYEEPVRNLEGNLSRIDLLWPGTCLVEHKSAGQDLGKAESQGMSYIRALTDEGREKEIPRYLILSDFQRVAIHDLEPEQDPDLPLLTRIPPSVEFPLKDLHKHIRHFAFIAGYKTHKLNPEDPANFEATELMAQLHDALYDGGFPPNELCQFLVRILFILFAEDTGLFPQDQFKLYLLDHTAADGSDLGEKLQRIFRLLDTPENKRQTNLDDDLNEFPYVNGDLFKDRLDFADFNSQMRDTLISCSEFHWEKISPAIFGSLFQTVFDHQDDRRRRQLGAHYTNEQNIMKVVRSLFLDDLRAEFEAAKKDRSGRGEGRLKKLQNHLATLNFLDPACGCGNFLVITYRELRQLELEILLELHKGQQQFEQDAIYNLSKIDVDQMHGIEIEEFPAKIAEVALWLVDHQANLLLSEAFGQFYRRIPLRKSPHIHHTNALETPWKTILCPEKCSFILGNPPFLGKKEQSKAQKKEIKDVWGDVKNHSCLDYVSAWYRIALNFISENDSVAVSFVSTNSITQGEQVSVMWPKLLESGANIYFAWRTFDWESEARGRAHVHCVIIGFSLRTPEVRTIYELQDDGIETATNAKNINPYLVDYRNIFIPKRRNPISAHKKLKFGNMPNDGGNLLVESVEDKKEILESCSNAGKFIKPFMGPDELMENIQRWCLWLVDAEPNEIKSCRPIVERLARVKDKRLESTRDQTNELAKTPGLFGEIRQPSKRFLAIPKTGSIRRRYLPACFLESSTIISTDIFSSEESDIYEFGIIVSAIHMAWLLNVGGRFKSDPRYSASLVYNNFPWPTPNERQKASIESAAQAILEARDNHSTSTLADLYDPVTMPPDLARAHQTLDRAVDRAYRPEPFPDDRVRVEHLFALYEQITAPLTPTKKSRGKKRAPKK